MCIRDSRNTFSQFTTSSSTNCGGIVTFFEKKDGSSFNLVYDQCKFIDITSTDATSNGGAVSFINSVNVTLANCLFRRNKACKHGGAVSIKVSGNVVIQSCTFEENRASSASSSASLLDEKTACRGGAIFLSQVSGSTSTITIL